MLINAEDAKKELLLTRSGCVWFLWLNVVYTLYLSARYFFHDQPDARSSAVLFFSVLILLFSLWNLILTALFSRNGFLVKRGVLLSIVLLYGILWGLELHSLYAGAAPAEFIILLSLLLVFPAVIAFHLSLRLIAAFATPVLLVVTGEVILAGSEFNLFLLFSYLIALVALFSARRVLIEWFRKSEESERHNARLIKKLTRLADRDPLTGLANKRYLREYFHARTATLPAGCDTVFLIMIDVDYFKKYNDHYGHLAGDQCLMQVARCISQSVRDSTDRVARFGGEEFTVLLLSSDKQGVRMVCERIQQNLARAGIPHAHSGISASVTVSLGAAQFKAGDSLDQLLAAADQQLYQAKREGRNRFCLD
ncbi:GGDEF domain-containing protein [Pantoea sp. USHLN298]|uniref:GGDEF domain-containing protein n=1 Tax=Pantoea sp. USHLN298 TaxID=3081294 RepID=UPI00301AE06C